MQAVTGPAGRVNTAKDGGERGRGEEGEGGASDG